MMVMAQRLVKKRYKPWSLIVRIELTNRCLCQTLEASASSKTIKANSQENLEANPENSKDESLSRVPTEPAARKLFIQQVSLFTTPCFPANIPNAYADSIS
jgi:hypothetical protein